MIKKIEKIKKLNIFTDWAASPTLSDFNQYNLFYAANGSGKSSLARLFQFFSDKGIHSEPDVEFKISTEGFGDITHDGPWDKFPVYTFNKSFIENNINWDSISKKILILDQAKITDVENFKRLKDELNAVNNETDALSKEAAKKRELIDKNLSSSAKEIKSNFAVLDASDSYYVSYNKTKLENLLDLNSVKFSDGSGTLTPPELEKTKMAIRPSAKTEISVLFEGLQFENYNKSHMALSGILEMPLVQFAIDRLKENPDIQEWIKNGLSLKVAFPNDMCDFCGNEISANRIAELNKHFSEEFEKMMERINKGITHINENLILIQLNRDIQESLFEEFAENYKQLIEDTNKIILRVNEACDSWKLGLEGKKKNPFKTSFTISQISSDLISGYNAIIEKINDVLKAHNNKVINYKKIVANEKRKAEIHFAVDAMSKHNVLKDRAYVGALNKRIGILEAKKDILTSEIKKIENSLSNETIAVADFNRNIHKFLGRNDIELEFVEKEKGYRIMRNVGHKSPAKNLSEGERSAIGLVYFITKIKEAGNKPEDLIIVVDDPINSMDSFSIHAAASFLRVECERVKQIFILTHNFPFFKLIRDWFDGKRTKDKKPKYAYFTIRASGPIPRKSDLYNMDDTLVYFNTEYQNNFKLLWGLKDKKPLTFYEMFAIGNLGRKVLESFLAFKFPADCGNFKQLLAKGVSDPHLVEEIYKFINQYSHVDKIDIGYSGDEDIVFSSHEKVVEKIIFIIKNLDQTHFDGLVSIGKCT